MHPPSGSMDLWNSDIQPHLHGVTTQKTLTWYILYDKFIKELVTDNDSYLEASVSDASDGASTENGFVSSRGLCYTQSQE
jgi:hypothetical protein